MLSLPVEVLCGGIWPYLSVRDLQALDTAFTNKSLRPQFRIVWKSYQYDSLDDAVLSDDQIMWLCGVGVNVISVVVNVIGSYAEAALANTSTLKRLHAKSKVHSTLLSKLASNSLGLEELHISKVYGPNVDNAVSALSQNCRLLHSLHINSKDLTDVGIKALAHCCLHLHTCCIGDSQVTDAGIQALCDNYPHLKSIGLSDCDHLTDASLIAIANSFPHLQNIRMKSCHFTDDGLIYFADKCRELRSVSVKCNHFTSRGLTALWAANPNLMDVDIVDNKFISNDDIIYFVQCCPLLQKLELNYCNNISDGALIAVAEHCPQLRDLNIRSDNEFSDASLDALGQHCHELKSINIPYFQYMSDVGIAALAEGCPLLQEISVEWSHVTDAGVVALARGCRDLRKISLWRGKSIGVAAISAIAKNCPLISKLLLSCCGINDACLYIIAQNCHNLTDLVFNNTKVSDAAAVIAVIKSCRMLREIVCYNCFKEMKDVAAIEQCSNRVEVYM